MSPDGPFPTKARRAWRTLAALGCILGAASILLTAIKWTSTDDQVARTAHAGEQAICAVADYADDQATKITGNPDASANLRELARRMRATGIHCPPPPIRPDR